MKYLRNLIENYKVMFYRSEFESKIIEIMKTLTDVNNPKEILKEFMLLEEELDKIYFDTVCCIYSFYL